MVPLYKISENPCVSSLPERSLTRPGRQKNFTHRMYGTEIGIISDFKSSQKSSYYRDTKEFLAKPEYWSMRRAGSHLNPQPGEHKIRYKWHV